MEEFCLRNREGNLVRQSLVKGLRGREEEDSVLVVACAGARLSWRLGSVLVQGSSGGWLGSCPLFPVSSSVLLLALVASSVEGLSGGSGALALGVTLRVRSIWSHR